MVGRFGTFWDIFRDCFGAGAGRKWSEGLVDGHETTIRGPKSGQLGMGHFGTFGDLLGHAAEGIAGVME